MEPLASQSSITLVIKAPNQRVKDIEVSCLLDWTVEKLKTHLANVYPTKPARSSQKIIYYGKLLDDHFILKDVLLENEGIQQTVHLVCTPAAPGNLQSSSNPTVCDPPTTMQAATPQAATPQATTPQATTPEVPSTPSATTQPDGLRQRQHAYQQHPFFSVYQGNPATFQSHGYHQVNANTTGTHFAYGQPYGAHYAAQHMAHMQWMQHMAQMHGIPYIPIQPPLPYPQQTIAQPQVNPPAPAAQAAQAQERQENRQQNRNIVMNANAGGGMMQEEDNNDEENVQRDWLDYIYMFVRIFMLMSIFWFYSSGEKLVLMGVIIFAVWILQSGWFKLRRAQRNRHQELQANAENNPEADGEDENDEDEEDGGGSDSGETGDSDETDINTTWDSNDSAPPPQPEHPGFFVVAFNFVTTFFSSLVPHGPRAVAQP